MALLEALADTLPTTCSETVGEVEALALLNKMHHSLADVKAETPVCTLSDVDRHRPIGWLIG